jgi:hypothetical protein
MMPKNVSRMSLEASAGTSPVPPVVQSYHMDGNAETGFNFTRTYR